VRRAFVYAALLMVCGCGRKSETGLVVDPSFRKLVPPDTTLLAGIQVDTLKTAPLYVKYGDRFNIARLSEFSRRTGLDPARDIASVLFASNGSQPLVMVRGRFSEEQVAPKLAGDGAQRSIYKKHLLIGSERDAVFFANPNLAVAGSESSLRAFIDERESSKMGIPLTLQTRLNQLPKRDQIYIVSSAGIPLSAFPARSDIQSSLSNIIGFINGLTVGLGVDDNLHLSAEIDCISEAGATRVNDALRGGIGLARLTTKNNQLDLLRLYDSVRVDRELSTVHITADIEGGLAAKLIDSFPQLRSGQ
jgi:hypothetical protein